jgi:superfamily II RNA helicase
VTTLTDAARVSPSDPSSRRKPRAKSAIANPSAPTSLLEAVLVEVKRAPSSTAREIARGLIGTPWAADKSQVNSVLYAGLGSSFAKDESTRPRWSATGNERMAAPASTARHRKQESQIKADTTPATGMEELLARLKQQPTVISRPVVERASAVEVPASWGMPLHPWQDEALRAWYAGGCRGIVEAVTGSGKTHLGLAAAARAAADGMATTVLVPSVELQRQWVGCEATHPTSPT